MSITADTAPVPMLTGPRHEEVLAALHQLLTPRTYLEIGIEQGQTLRAARCPSIAIDPVFSIDQSIIGEKPECLLYRMPSDRFFDKHDPVTLLGEQLDLAFLDGLHLYEFLLRDFINVEACCRRNSVIVLHDCVPTDLYLARRDRQDESLRAQTRIPGGWCGDVWKTVLILRAYRPDLRIETFDSAYTGVVLVTNLDPESQVLTERYVEAVESFAELSLQDYGLHRYIDELAMRDARSLFDPVQLARYVWM
ncbi:class I SAM-dependent methyltransferase [Rhodopila globiformis]|nr:class I SAM-dependent methyltransferase [Rhodopila globiformis]